MGTLTWILMGLAAGVLYLLGEIFIDKKEVTLADVLQIAVFGGFSGPIGLVVMLFLTAAVGVIWIMTFASEIVVFNGRKK